MIRTLLRFSILSLITIQFLFLNGSVFAAKEQSIFFNLPSSFLCSSSTLSLSEYASATSGLEVKFNLVTGTGSISELGVFTPQKPGLFFIKAIQAGNSEYDSAFAVTRSILVTSQFFSTNIPLSLNIKSSLCIGDSASFSIAQANGLTYLWEIADTLASGNKLFIPTIKSNITTTSKVIIYERFCEVGSYQFKPNIFEKEVISSNFIPNEAISGDTILLNPSNKNGVFKQSEIQNFAWFVPFKDQQLVSYIYSDTNNCKIEIAKEVRINRNNVKNILIYEYVTPNGDGKNDVVFIIDLNRFSENELLLYNRWGNSIFSQKNYRNDWSPTELAKDLYYYVLKLGNGRLVYTGNIYVSN